MKKILLFVLILGFINVYAQQDPYKQAQAQQKREWQATERHYESMKPSTPYKSTSGSYSSSIDIPKLFTMKADRKKEEERKTKEGLLLRSKNKFIALVRERRDLERTYKNYETFKAIGTQAGLDESTILTLIGKDANEYLQMAFNNYTLVGSCYVIKLNTNSSAATNNYDYRSYQSAQDFNSYLQEQNSNQTFNSLSEKTNNKTTLEPLSNNNQNGDSKIVLNGLNTEKVNGIKKTQVLESLMLNNKNSFSVDRDLFIEMPSFSIETNNNKSILDSLKLSSQNNTPLPVLKPLNQNANPSATKTKSIFESLKIKEAKPAKDNSLYKKLINLE